MSVRDDADDEADVDVDTPLMLSLSFVAMPSTTTATLSVEDGGFLAPKTLEGSSRGRTSRDGVGVICVGSLGSSESDWSSLLSEVD